MGQSQQVHSAVQKRDVRLQALNGVVSYALKHHDWSAPLADVQHWERALPGCANYRVRAILMQYAEQGDLIKVITRVMPEALTIRPPSWGDLRDVSLFAESRRRRDAHSVSACSPFCHFFPSPSYLKSLPVGSFESPEHKSWILGEAQRIWQELQREDNRALVTSNVPNEMAAVTQFLTTKLFSQLTMYPTINRNDAHVAVVAVVKATGFSLPLKDGDEVEILRLAKERLMKGRDADVRTHFEALRVPAWRF